MSRSYKHTPYCGNTKNKFAKRYANKKVRKTSFEETFQHGGYKKISESWDICDYSQIEFSYKDFIKSKYFDSFTEVLEENYQYYLKYYIRK